MSIKCDLPGDYSGDVPMISVNAKRFIALLEQINFGEVSLHITGSAKAIVITSSEDADYLSLIMPLMS